jgi:hypothetical protein
MTVCTNDLALVDLGEDSVPGAVSEALGYAEGLLSEVVELEDQWVRLAAVRAGMLAEVVEEIGGALGGERLLTSQGLGDVAGTVGGVVLALVGGTARAAVVVALAAVSAAPREVLRWLVETATAAASRLRVPHPAIILLAWDGSRDRLQGHAMPRP